jgi:hypothetical protein
MNRYAVKSGREELLLFPEMSKPGHWIHEQWTVGSS